LARVVFLTGGWLIAVHLRIVWRLKAMPPIERHEHHRNLFLNFPLIACAPHPLEYLRSIVTDGQHHASAISELRAQRARDDWRGSSDQDRIKRRHIGQPLASATDVQLDVLITQRVEHV